MADEAIRGTNHPIAPDDIRHCLAGGIARNGPPDPRILSQNIVDPPFYDQPVFEEILANRGVPEEGGIISGERASLLLPGIIAGCVKLQPGKREPAQLEAVVLGPVVGGKAWIDGTDGGAIIAIGIQPDAVVVGHVFPDGKAAAGVVIVVVTQLIAYIADVAACGSIEVCAEIDTDG